MTKTTALFINNHPYAHFDRGGTHILPTSEIEIHMVARQRVHGGVSGFADHPLDHVALCDADDEARWREICEWTLRNHPISRVIAVHERAVLLAAEMRSKFGLAGMDHETATRFRDKVRMKEAVRSAGAAAVPDFAPSTASRTWRKWTGPPAARSSRAAGASPRKISTSSSHWRMRGASSGVWTSPERTTRSKSSSRARSTTATPSCATGASSSAASASTWRIPRVTVRAPSSAPSSWVRESCTGASRH